MARYTAAALAGAAAFTLLPGACDRPPADPVVTRDSAGVAITVSYEPAWGPDQVWRIDPEPETVIGGLAGQRPYEFTTVGEARLLDDGRILVTHCSNPPELRLYGRDGAFLGSLGGPGSGPGQCNFILHSWMAADSVLLYDPSLARITYFALAGGAPRVIDLGETGLGDVEAGAPLWISRFDDGTLLGRPNRPEPVEDGRSRAPFHFLRLDPDGLSVDTVVEALGSAYVVDGLGTAEEDVRPVLFSPFTHAVAHGSRVYLADSQGFWIEERHQDGTLIRRFGRDWEPVPIDRGFRRAYADQRLAAAPGSQRSAVRREMARAVFAEHFPAHDGELIVDPEGHLWVGHVRTPEDPDRAWSVFDPEGRWLGEVHVPPELRITDIAGAHVLGVWRDADGVQTIRRFALLKPGL